MNFCRRCESEYSEPGTCNCFSPVVRTMPLPYYPYPYVYPVHPYYPPWYGTVTSDPMPIGDTITITNMDSGAVTRSGGGPISGNTATLPDASPMSAGSTPTVGLIPVVGGVAQWSM